jgi:hypothetical protein
MVSPSRINGIMPTDATYHYAAHIQDRPDKLVEMPQYCMNRAS